MQGTRRIAAAAALALACLAGGTAHACPGCKEAVAEQKGEQAKLKDGYYYSILMMMAMPFALLGTGAYLVRKAVKSGALPEM